MNDQVRYHDQEHDAIVEKCAAIVDAQVRYYNQVINALPSLAGVQRRMLSNQQAVVKQLAREIRELKIG